MLNNSLFIAYSTPNYSKLTNILLNSLNLINANNINHFVDIPPEILITKTGFQTDLWYYCIRNKINHLIEVLTNYDNLPESTEPIHDEKKYFIFTDCDICYIKNNINEWQELEKFINNNNNDIFFMREGTSNEVNSGFFIIKNNNNINNIKNFFVQVLNIFDISEKKDIPFGDQTIINNLLSKRLSNINYDYIPNDYVIFGKHIFNKKKSLFHHAIGCIDIEDKLLQINYIKSLF